MMKIGRPRRRHVIDQSGRLHKLPNHINRNKSILNLIQIQTIAKWVGILIVTLAGIFLLWAIVTSVIAFRKVSDTKQTKRAPALSFFGEVKPNQLQGEGDGRVNVLLIGIGGAKHPGGQLADTIMVVSFDPKNKDVAMLSVPRDLYVPIEGFGYGKINSSHSSGLQKSKDPSSGPNLTKKTVSKILDLPIHYYVRIDFSGLEKIVDTLGGVTVNVENPIVDLSYPAENMIDFAPFRLSAGEQKLNGKIALKYVRSRHAAGAEGSDFARARRQQLLIEAVKDKAMSVGVLTNPKKITDLIGIVGDHVKTDISLSAFERFVELWKNIDTKSIVTKVLDNGPDGPLVSHSGDERGSILLPRAGDFSEVQAIAHSIFTDPYLRQEQAKISFINATGNLTVGKQVVKQLTSYGYKVIDNTASDQSIAKATTIVDNKGSAPFTVKFLESRFKSSAKLKKDKNATADIVLTLGTNFKSPTAASELSTTNNSLKKIGPSVSPKVSPSATIIGN